MNTSYTFHSRESIRLIIRWQICFQSLFFSISEFCLKVCRIIPLKSIFMQNQTFSFFFFRILICRKSQFENLKKRMRHSTFPCIRIPDPCRQLVKAHIIHHAQILQPVGILSFFPVFTNVSDHKQQKHDHQHKICSVEHISEKS